MKQIKFQTLSDTKLSITSIGLKRIVKISPGSTFFWGKNVTFFKQRCKKFLAEGGIHERPKKMGGKAKKGMGRRNVEKGKVRLGRVFER